MNTGRKKKIALFNKYSQNLEHLKTHLEIASFGREYQSDIYICPLSFKAFTREHLNECSDNQLTAEHAPPNSLKGKIVALTAKLLNNQSGHLFDVKIQEYINEEEFKEGLSVFPTKFKINKDFSLRGLISRSEKLEFHIQTKSFHQGAERFLNLWKSQAEFCVELSLPKSKRPDLAFLRIAYLLAFGKLGYSLLFGGASYVNQNMELLREQLEKPEASLIANIPILREQFPDDFLGVSIIKNPKELRSVLVVFDLETENKKHRYGVLLPGPDKYGFKVYDCLKELSNKQKIVNFDIQPFPKKLDLTKYDDSIRFLRIWGELFGNEKN